MRCQVHPDDLSKLDATFRELRHAGGSSRADYRLAPRTDQERAGRQRWVTLEGTVVRRTDGRPEQLLGVTRDITERKLAEEALRTSEERLRRVSDNADVGLIRCSRDWFYLSANPAYAKIAGKPLDQIVGRPMAEVMGAEAVETIRPYVERVLRGEHVIFEAEVPYAGAGTRYMHVSYTPDTDATGQIVGWVACITDITERKQGEQALYERNAQLALAGRAALVGSYAYDVKTRMLQFSEGYAAIYDLPDGTSEMTGNQRRALVHPEDLEQLDRVRSEAFEQQRAEFSLVYRNVLPKRGVRWIESRSLILYDSNGHPERVVGVNIDVTERKQMEQALADRNRQLQLAGKAALVGSFVIDIDAARKDFRSQRIKFSPGFAAIYGLSDDTVEISLGDWRSLVHPDDLPQFLKHREQLFAERRG